MYLLVRIVHAAANKRRRLSCRLLHAVVCRLCRLSHVQQYRQQAGWQLLLWVAARGTLLLQHGRGRCAPCTVTGADLAAWLCCTCNAQRLQHTKLVLPACLQKTCRRQHTLKLYPINYANIQVIPAFLTGS
jgi:hypothetical protein